MYVNRRSLVIASGSRHCYAMGTASQARKSRYQIADSRSYYLAPAVVTPSHGADRPFVGWCCPARRFTGCIEVRMLTASTRSSESPELDERMTMPNLAVP